MNTTAPALKTGEHILHYRVSEGVVISWCACERWYLDSATRSEAEEAHATHLESVMEQRTGGGE